jgi:methylated-DNA-[protein]-cysteine S-methyltransferase
VRQNQVVPTHTVMPSPIGDITVVSEDGAVTRVLTYSQKHAPAPSELGERDDVAGAEAVRQLTEYFARERTVFDLPLAPHGDEFKQRVWALLREIPYGETRSYGDLARALGDVNLSQAVGFANGRNPIAIVVPCHRVIGSDGSLVGYAGGLDRKRFLLALEETEEARSQRLF